MLKLDIGEADRNLFFKITGGVCGKAGMLAITSFTVMLVYYLKWHAMKRIKPLIDTDKGGSSKRWDFYHVVERLKSIRLSEKIYQGNVAYTSISRPDEEQSEILKLLGVSLM